MDDIMGKALTWPAVRRAGERGLQIPPRFWCVRECRRANCNCKLRSRVSGHKVDRHIQGSRGEANAGKVTNCCTRIQERGPARLVCRDTSTGGTALDTLDCSEALAIVGNNAHRCISCIFPRQGSEATTGAFARQGPKEQ